MKVKIGRHDPCPCGSGKKLKKCGETLPASPASAASYSWMAPDGVHVVAPGGPLTPAAWDHLTQTYQNQVRQSPMWKQMVQEFGKAKAAERLKEFQVKPG